MIIVLSPAKTLDLEPQELTSRFTIPEFIKDSEVLIAKLAKLSKPRVARLMNLSDNLAALNVRRYRDWHATFTVENAKQALLTFKGDVYLGFDCDHWKTTDFTYAQKHLRILSGLHGVLRPLDLIQPYRLEMGTKLKTRRGDDLYEFWGKKITAAVGRAITSSKSNALVNLSSQEYFRAIHPEHLSVPVVTPSFKDEKNGTYRVISFFAKRARGLMANFIIRNRIKTTAGLRKFKDAGYYFDPQSSDELRPVFLRDEV